MNNSSLDSLLLTLLATQTPEAIRTEGDYTILAFPFNGTRVELGFCEFRTEFWACTRYYPAHVNVCMGDTKWGLTTESRDVIDAFHDCIKRTNPKHERDLKQAEIIAALKSITATP